MLKRCIVKDFFRLICEIECESTSHILQSYPSTMGVWSVCEKKISKKQLLRIRVPTYGGREVQKV